MTKTQQPNARNMTPAQFKRALVNVAFTDAARLARAAENERLVIIIKKYGAPKK